jgi:hypothetical protein
MATIKLELEIEEVNSLLNVLGELPSKTGAWNLIVKIKGQAEPQVATEGKTSTQDIITASGDQDNSVSA